MILDTLSNISLYSQLNPLFPQVVEWLSQHDLNTIPVGHYEIQGSDLFVNIVDSAPKTRQQAKLETHNRMIDIQIAIGGTEEHGYTHRSQLPEAGYDADKDISFYTDAPDGYITMRPGQFVIYFPQDGHAPAITPVTLRKAIFKVRA